METGKADDVSIDRAGLGLEIGDCSFGNLSGKQPVKFALELSQLNPVIIPRPEPLDFDNWDPGFVRRMAFGQYKSLIEARYDGNSPRDTDRKDNITRCCMRLAVAGVPIPCWISKRFDDFENYGRAKMPNYYPPITFVWCPDKMDKSLKELVADLSRYCPPRTVYTKHSDNLLTDYWAAISKGKQLPNLSQRIEDCRAANSKLRQRIENLKASGTFIWDRSIALR